jgi:uracil-DNA glycosylase family 4
MNVGPSGPLDAEWAVVGEAPGYNEAQQGKPFVGSSGQLLRDTLARIGLPPDTAYYTNVIKEYKAGNPTPTTKEINAARTALALELAALPNLKAVLLVGNVPLTAASGHGGITKNRGMVHGVHEAFPLDVPLFATIHPAAVLRNNKWAHGFTKDLAAFRLMVDPPEPHGQVIEVHAGTYQAWAEAYREAHHGTIDIETTIDKEGEHYRAGVTMVSVAMTFDGETAWVWPLSGHPEGYITLDEFVRAMRNERPDPLPWTMHNGYFDRLRLRMSGWDPLLAHDTMAMAYILNPDDRKGLEYLSSVLLGEPPYKGVDYKNILTEGMDKIIEMNGQDVLRTHRLKTPLFEKLNARPDLSRVYQFILMPAINVAIEATQNGVPIDRLRLEELRVRLEIERDDLLENIQQTKPGLNPNSTQQLAKLWYEEWGLPVYKRTETGAPSTDSEVRTLLAMSMSPANPKQAHIAAVDRFKKVTKRLSAYVAAWPRYMDEEGRVHPSYKLMKVLTGRTSAADPNIQNVPHETDYRRVFGGVPGWTWVRADLSQIELRTAAYITRDPRLLEAYRNGEDLHMVTAKLVLGEETKEARYRAKTLNFGLLYEAGPEKLREIALFEYGVKFTPGEAKTHHQNFFSTYHGLKKWHREQKARMHSEGRSVSPLGRVRYLPDLYSDEVGLRLSAEREGINHPIQSLASDILLLSLTEINKRLDHSRAQVIAMVHDEIGLLVRNDYVHDVVEMVKHEMENPPLKRLFGIDMDVPLVAEVTTGEYWA